MKRDERRQAIMDLLIEHRAVELDDLSEKFAVSRMTIHRDLDDLEQAGLLRKVRGGATSEPGTQFESDFRIREQQDIAHKTRVAREALQLIEPGMTVMINDGVTAALLGDMLEERRPLTVITNNCAIIDRLRGLAGITLISLGGIYSSKFNCFFGVVTETALTRLRADIAMISVPAVDGTNVFHMDENVVRAKRAMMDAARRKCLLVNHKRFGRTALHQLADIAEFDAVITDAAPPAASAETFQELGVRITIAS